MSDKIVHVALADIVKTAPTEDGTLLVYGKAADPTLDLDAQICDPAWLAQEMPEWFKSGANMREMHQPIAAGVGKDLEIEGDSYYVLSEAVDPGTIRKLEKGVLQGYSIGIKSPRVVKDAAAPNGRMVGGKIIEVSYVDRPSNPTTKTTIAKAADAAAPEDAAKPESSQTPQTNLEAVDEVAKIVDKTTPAPEAAKSLYGAEDVAATRGQLRALFDMLPEDADGTEAIIRSLISALLSFTWVVRVNEEDEVFEEDGAYFFTLADTKLVAHAKAADVDAALEAIASAHKALAPAAPPAPSSTKGDLADKNKVPQPDDSKLSIADEIKTALADGLKPVQEKLVGVSDRLDKIEQQPAESKVVLHSQERTSSVNDFTQLDPRVALSALRTKHATAADQAADPTMRQAHMAKVADIDRMLAK